MVALGEKAMLLQFKEQNNSISKEFDQGSKKEQPKDRILQKAPLKAQEKKNLQQRIINYKLL